MKKLTIIITLCIFCLATILVSCKKEKDQEAKIILPQSFQDTVDLAIPDGVGSGSGGTPGMVTSTISVPLNAAIKDATKVTIELELEHTWCGDIVAELITPSGVSVGALIKRMGATLNTGAGDGSNFVAGQFFKFTAGNTTNIDLTPNDLVGGNFKPTKGGDDSTYPEAIPLADLNNLNSVAVKGDWKLKLYDHGGGDVGKLLSWKITFTEGAF